MFETKEEFQEAVRQELMRLLRQDEPVKELVGEVAVRAVYKANAEISDLIPDSAV